LQNGDAPVLSEIKPWRTGPGRVAKVRRRAIRARVA